MLFVGAKFKMIFALLSVACAVQTTCKVDEMVARMPLALNEDSAGTEESDTTEVTSGPVQEKLSFPHGGTQANGTASVTETHRQPEGQAEQANTTQPSIVTPVVDGAEVAQLEGEGTLFDNGIAQSSLVEPSQFSSGMSQPLCYQFQQAEKRLPEAGEKCCKERSLTPETQYTCNTYDWCIRACPLVLKRKQAASLSLGKRKVMWSSQSAGKSATKPERKAGQTSRAYRNLVCHHRLLHLNHGGNFIAAHQANGTIFGEARVRTTRPSPKGIGA
jgi:hypothetical protein